MLRSLAKAGPSSSVATARAPTRAAGARRQAWRVRATAEFASGYQMSAEDVKAALLDSLYGTDRGLTARSEVRAEIDELITQLEACNPTTSPTEDADKLSGTWKLAYTSGSELIAVLALSRLPGVEIGDISQTIDTRSMKVQNKVDISVPLSKTSVSTSANLEVRSPKRLQVKFNQGSIATLQLLDNVDIPGELSIMGQRVDLQPIQPVLEPLKGVAQQGLSLAQELFKQLPKEASLPIQGDQAQTWLITTYLDDNLRISRGPRGSVFILTKDVPPGPAPGETYGEAAAKLYEAEVADDKGAALN